MLALKKNHPDSECLWILYGPDSAGETLPFLSGLTFGVLERQTRNSIDIDVRRELTFSVAVLSSTQQPTTGADRFPPPAPITASHPAVTSPSTGGGGNGAKIRY